MARNRKPTFAVDRLQDGRLFLILEDGRKFSILTDTEDEPTARAELSFEETDETGVPQKAEFVSFQ